MQLRGILFVYVVNVQCMTIWQMLCAGHVDRQRSNVDFVKFCAGNADRHTSIGFSFPIVLDELAQKHAPSACSQASAHNNPHMPRRAEARKTQAFHVHSSELSSFRRQFGSSECNICSYVPRS